MVVRTLASMELTDIDREMLALERQWFRYPGVKEQQVRERFDLSMTAYYHRLVVLASDPAAIAADPVTTRLIRQRIGRRRVA